MTQTQFGPSLPFVHRRTAPSASEFYRAEAARLRDMARSSDYHQVRDGLRCIAREYELLADQRDGLLHHRFGRPLRRPVMNDGYPSLDDRQDNGADQDNAADHQCTG